MKPSTIMEAVPAIAAPVQKKRKYEKRVPSSNKKGSVEERYWAKVDKRGPNDCWPWLAAVTAEGYGFMRGGTREDGRQITVRAPKVAYELEYGPLPAGKIVMHECDTPGCCNPRHLKAGTYSQNSIDAVIRGRTKRKLTDRQVIDIVAIREESLIPGNRSRSFRSIGAQFDVSEFTTWAICHGKLYGWLTGIGHAKQRKAA